MNPLISVIIPVYNVEKYLEKCLDSVINQTYKNIEIILVDDGSTDNSGVICDEYKEKYKGITVIHKKNEGVAKARNTGKEYVRGEYFCFIDSDDFITENYIQVLFDLAEKYGADIACCGYKYIWPDGKEKRTICADKPDSYEYSDKGINVICGMLHGKSMFLPSCCCKIFRTSTAGDFAFPEFLIGEDFLASMDYYAKAEKVAYINMPMYCYLQNDDSAMHSVNPEKIYNMILSGDCIYDKSVKLSPSLKKAASHYVIEINMLGLMKLWSCENCNDKINHIKANIKKHRFAVIFDTKASFRVWASCVVSLLGFNALYKIRNATLK